ncbi:hypothetical protein Syun_030808 [Stephania yunnanensis]|uniref:Cupin type-1 domain-containing protein n=1 Tax=Stephania yunnanensis TaxID=152371 RepID=A0AAP0DUW2_9MAGN
MGLIDCLLVFLIACLALKSSFVLGSDPSPLQDFCVAIDESNHEAVYVNGKFCKNPKNVTADDFYLSGFDVPSNASNPFRSNTTLGTVDQIPGLNTLGISVFRADLKPKGIIPLHGHPRGSEIVIVMEGCLYVGFVTSDPNNQLMAKHLKPGDVFVFPPGLVHFLYNDGDTDAVVYAAANSQNPDITTARVFRNVPVEVLSKSFNAERKVIEEIIKGISIPLIRDLCVAINDLKDAVLVNGKLCKDPSLVTTNDFFLPGFDKPGNTSNAFGSGMTPATIDQIPGRNGQGISLVRIDFAPKGVLPMSYRGEGSQILLVMEGTLYVGFVTSDPANRLISKVLHKGDVYALPQGFPYVIYNVNHTCNAVAIVAINNQSPYFFSIKAIFGSEPTIAVEFLAKSFKLDEKEIEVALKQWKMDE